MPSDYFDAAKHISKVRFPGAKRVAGGGWVQCWRIVLVADALAIREWVAGIESEMAQDDFRVKIVEVTPNTFDLIVTTAADFRQSRFLFATYRALQLFDQKVGRISSIEGYPREHWSPFRDG